MTEAQQQAALEALLASPTLELTPGTAALLLDGRLTVERAFQAGLLRGLDASTCAQWVEATGAEPRPPPPSPAPPMPGQAVRVDREEAQAFAQAIGARGDWGAGPDAVAHPMLHTRLLYPLLRALMSDPRLGPDRGRVLHGQHDARFFSAMRPGDRLAARGAFEPPRIGPRATALSAQLTLLRAGLPVVQARSTFLVPSQPGPPRAGPTLPQLRPPDAERELHVAEDQAHRYAAASLDDNPIHLDDAAARAAGHPGTILHGLCTLALAGEEVLTELSDGDPRTLSRLAGRFRRPVRPGQRLRLRLWQNRPGARFDLIDEDERLVLDEGIAELGRKIR